MINSVPSYSVFPVLWSIPTIYNSTFYVLIDVSALAHLILIVTNIYVG